MVDYGRYKNLIVDKADKVATLTFNRPERLNAFKLNDFKILEKWKRKRFQDKRREPTLCGRTSSRTKSGAAKKAW